MFLNPFPVTHPIHDDRERIKEPVAAGKTKGMNAKVWGNAEVWGNAKVWGNAEVFSASHVLVIGAIGSRDDFTTFFRDKDNEITVKCGCFLGKIDKFLEKVTQTHGDSKYALVYRAAVEVARLQIDLSGEAPKDADE